MSITVHKLVKEDGAVVYRRWDAVCDRYASGELTEVECRELYRRTRLLDLLYELVDDDEWKRMVGRLESRSTWEEEVVHEGEVAGPLFDAPGFDDIERRFVLANELTDVLFPALLEELGRLGMS